MLVIGARVSLKYRTEKADNLLAGAINLKVEQNQSKGKQKQILRFKGTFRITVTSHIQSEVIILRRTFLSLE